MKLTRLSLILALSYSAAFAQMLPPPIPSGPIEYTNEASLPSPLAAEDTVIESGMNVAPVIGAPILEAPSSSEKAWDIALNLYTSNYNVRGMGVTNQMSDWGFSSLSGRYIHSNRNMFNVGVYQQFDAQLGTIWGAGDALGGEFSQFAYTLGKEIFPNAKLSVGYALRHGGLEGFLAEERGKTHHNLTQDLTISLTYNDYQQGFFGAALASYSFYGLTGWYYDVSVGYRFTDVIAKANLGLDIEVIAGLALSDNYWTRGTTGLDAARLRVNFIPYSLRGSFGREEVFHIIPWIEATVTGDSDRSIRRDFGAVIDQKQINVGIELRWKF